MSVKSMTWKLIGWNLVWGILASFIIQIPRGIAKLITGDNLFIYVVINLVLSAIANYLVWKFSISTAFKKYTVNHAQAGYIIKNLMIFVIILSILSCIIDVIESRDFTKELQNSSDFKKANMLSSYLSKDKKEEYNKTLQKSMKEAQGQVTAYTAFIGIGGIIINIGALQFNKKNMYAKAMQEETIQENIVDEYRLR